MQNPLVSFWSTLPVSTAILTILAAVIFLLIGIRFGTILEHRKQKNAIKDERRDAVKHSRAVIGGQCTEQLAPYLPGFPADATEVRFIGKPIDYIAFTGAATEEVSEVVFIEVKTGQSALSKTERSLKKAIELGHVRWVEYRP